MQVEKNISASAFMAAADAEYRDQVMTKPGFGFALNDPIMARIDAGKDSGSEHHRFSTPLSRSLQKLKFAWVKDGFINALNSQVVQKRVRIAYYVIPVTFSVACASFNYLQHSFLIYLKYQALVDSYRERPQ